MSKPVRSRSRIASAIAAAVLAAAGGPARAQLAGALPGLPLPDAPGLPGAPLDRLGEPLGDTLERASPRERLRLRETRLRSLVRRNPDALETDPQGWPVIRAEILVTGASATALDRARRGGFEVLRETRLEELGLTIVVLSPPAGLSVRRAIERLRQWDPQASYEYNHVYLPSGAVAGSIVLSGAAAASGPGGVVGLIDTGVDRAHPALAGIKVEARGFAGGYAAGPHGTAVASLLAGRSGDFRGSAPGATLFAADVYGQRRVGGSAENVARALAWMAGKDVPVVNISLVGPRNAAMEASVRALVARGHLLVAAVGNDGPAAPPSYPAAFPGVIGVTAVNARGRVLPEAGRGAHVDFAAPGSDMAAAGGKGWVSVRGSSFAAPLVAGLLAARLSRPDPAAAARAFNALAADAADAGTKGPDPVYGRGVVGAGLRVPPARVGARGVLTQ